MNKVCQTIWALLILSGFAAGTCASGDGLATPLPRSMDPCNEAFNGLEGGVSLLRYYGWLRSIPVDEQAKQYECANSIDARGEPGGKMVSALTLMVPDAPFADFARAKVLLNEYLHDADKEKPEDRSLASLMLMLLDDVARLEEQLEQLKAIEKDITETEQSVNVPTPTPPPAPEDEREENDTSSR